MMQWLLPQHLHIFLEVLTKGDISRHAEGDCLWQGCGLGEEVQVVQGKDELDGFIHLNGNL